MPTTYQTIPIPLYNGVLYVYRNREFYNRTLKAYGIKPDDYCAGRCVELFKKGRTMYLLGWFNRNRATLVHELGHAAIFIITNAGMKVEDSGGEAY